MRVSKEQAARNRERVLEAASTLYRERGFDGIGVADVMRSAGLTHGGFYGQFASKADLMAEACAHALESSARTWRHVGEQALQAPLDAVVDWYLSTEHRDHPGIGCALAALAPEAARQGPQVRRAVTRGVKPLIELIAAWLPGRSQRARRQRAVLALSSMVGAMVIARVVDDEVLSKEFLDAAAKALREHPPSKPETGTTPPPPATWFGSNPP